MAHESNNSLPSPPNDHEPPGAAEESNQYEMNPILDDRQEQGPYPDVGSPSALDRKNTQLPRKRGRQDHMFETGM